MKPSALELQYRAFRESLGDIRIAEPITALSRDDGVFIGTGRRGRPKNFKRGKIAINLARRIP